MTINEPRAALLLRARSRAAPCFAGLVALVALALSLAPVHATPLEGVASPPGLAVAFMYGRRTPEYKAGGSGAKANKAAETPSAPQPGDPGVSQTVPQQAPQPVPQPAPARPSSTPFDAMRQSRGKPLGHDSQKPFPEASPAWRPNSPLPPAPGPRMQPTSDRDAISPTLQPSSPYAPASGQNPTAPGGPPKGEPAGPSGAPSGAPSAGKTRMRAPQNDHIRGVDRNGVPQHSVRAAPRARDSGPAAPLRPLQTAPEASAPDGRSYYGPPPAGQ